MLSEIDRRRLRWRARRGLLENDLLIERFFARHDGALTVAQGRGLTELMALADNDLLDLLLRRMDEAEQPLARESREVLEMLRMPLPADRAQDRLH